MWNRTPVPIFLSTLVFLGTASSSEAQSASDAGHPLILQEGPDNSQNTFHRNAFGKSCLMFEAVSRAHRENAKLYDHVVSIENQCGQKIKVSVCYYHTQDCLDAEVGAYKRTELVLGIFPLQYFRYSYKEKFGS